MLITRTFSLTNFIIASSALGFQVFVLYPWHTRLDSDFERLHSTQMKFISDETIRSEQEKKERLEEISGVREELRLMRELKENKGILGKEAVGGTNKDGERLV